jgi:hypothetical protein
MGLSPEGQGLGLTVGPEGQRSSPLEIDQHGPIGLAFAIRSIVNAEHVGGGHAWQGQTAQQAQERMATDGQAQGPAQSYPRPAPSAIAMGTSQCMSRCVRRAQGATSGDSRSVKIRRVQRPLAQKNFRTHKWSTTCHDPQGRSATLRT